MSRVEARAREEEPKVPAGERVYIQNATLDQDEPTVRFYRGHGYEPVRGFRGMVIELDEEPEVAPVDGIEIRPYVHPGEAQAFFEAHQEAFASHWEFEAYARGQGLDLDFKSPPRRAQYVKPPGAVR